MYYQKAFWMALGCMLMLSTGLYGQGARKWIRKGIATDDKPRKIEYFRKAIEKDPFNADAYVFYGNVRYSQGLLKAAVKQYDNALLIDPAHGLAHLNRGNAKLVQADYDAALDDFTQALEVIRDNPQLFNNRAAAHLYLGDPQSALRDISRALELDPYLEKSYLLRGRAYGKLGQLDDAIEAFNRALEIDHGFAEAYHRRGEVYFRQMKFEEALADQNAALELNPQMLTALADRAECKIALKQWDEAIEDLDFLIERTPLVSSLYGQKGAILYSMGLKEEALVLYEKAVELDPYEFLNLFVLGCLRAELGNYVGSLEVLRDAHALGTDHLLLYPAMASTSERLGQFEAALVHLDSALCSTPRDAKVHNNIGYNKLALGRFAEAVNDLGRCLELDSNHAYAYNNLGYALMKLGRHQEAIRNFDESIRKENDYPWMVLTNRGQAREARGEFDLARADYRKALELNPEFRRATFRLEEMERCLASGSPEEECSKVWLVNLVASSSSGERHAPPNNAIAVLRYFRDQAGLSPSQIVHLSDTEATRSTILEKTRQHLTDPARIRPQDLVVFYFAGGGALTDSGPGFLPFDPGQAKKPITDQEILEIMATSPARRKLCVLETHFSNDTVGENEQTAIHRQRSTYNSPVALLSVSTFGAKIPDTEDGIGLFTRCLISGLRRAGDIEQKGLPSLGDLYSYLSDVLPFFSKGSLFPTLNHGCDPNMWLLPTD